MVGAFRGLGFFYLTAPLLWRLEQRLAKRRIGTEAPQVAIRAASIDSDPDLTEKKSGPAAATTSIAFDATPIPAVSHHTLLDLLREIESQSASRPFRSPIAGALLVFVGLILLVIGFVAAIRTDWGGLAMAVVSGATFLGAEIGD